MISLLLIITFNELKDLGNVETNLIDGITFYFLSEFPTLREAQNIRQKVVDRGVTDAAITIFYNGEKISSSDFKSLAQL